MPCDHRAKFSGMLLRSSVSREICVAPDAELACIARVVDGTRTDAVIHRDLRTRVRPLPFLDLIDRFAANFTIRRVTTISRKCAITTRVRLNADRGQRAREEEATISPRRFHRAHIGSGRLLSALLRGTSGRYCAMPACIPLRLHGDVPRRPRHQNIISSICRKALTRLAEWFRASARSVNAKTTRRNYSESTVNYNVIIMALNSLFEAPATLLPSRN